ncbi:unnamed protein product, partial [Dicrocoelium dendriticum]
KSREVVLHFTQLIAFCLCKPDSACKHFTSHRLCLELQFGETGLECLKYLELLVSE